MLTSNILILSLLSKAFSTAIQPSAKSSWGPYQNVETTHDLPFEWTYQETATKDTVLKLRLVVRSHNGDEFTKKLMQISTPGNEKYGSHLSQKELLDLVAPPTGVVESLTSWLSSFPGVNVQGIRSETSSIDFETTVAAANNMLKTDFNVYRTAEGSETIIRSLEYSLPSSIKQNVGLIHPITHFPKPDMASRRHKQFKNPELSISKRQNSLIPSECRPGIYPACIAQLYNIDYTPPTNSSPSGSKLGVAGFLEQYINHTDVNSFIRKYGNSESTRNNPGNFTVEVVNGGINDESIYGIEATLDMEYSMPFTGSLPVVYYSTGGRSPSIDPSGNPLPPNQSSNEPYLEWLQYLLEKADNELPQVLSISYTDTEQTNPRDYAVHVCDLFGRLAARGVSIIDASGDGGIAGQGDTLCVSNDGQNRPTFLPTFPASCPWVTSIGSTSLFPQEGSSFSSGGFSNYFAVPDYQRNSTGGYITSLNGQFDGLYNISGRGIPDLALYGSRYETENFNTSSGHHSGTSAGTPVFAAMIALINDMRLQNGKPVLGWLNPLLYSSQMTDTWNDITAGTAYGCDEQWNAVPGWDPVTGLGTPDFKRMVSVLL